MAKETHRESVECPNCGAVIDYDLPDPEQHPLSARGGPVHWKGETDCPKCGYRVGIELRAQDHPFDE